jgi:alpha-L-fucosidase 2
MFRKISSNSIICSLLTLALFASCSEELVRTAKPDRLPNYELKFDGLATTWDEGIPLGNSTLGALVWQKDGKLRFSLDRSDLWDLRPMENLNFQNFDFKWVYEQWKNNTYKNVQDKYDAPYDNLPAPSKIPGGALEFDITGLGEIKNVKLNLASAACIVEWKNGTILKTFVHATEPIGWYQFENLKTPIRPTIVPPPYFDAKESKVVDPVTGQDLRRLEYKEGTVKNKHNSITYDQSGWDEFKFQVYTKWEEKPDALVGSWSISSQKSKDETVTTATEIVETSFFNDFWDTMETHSLWWHRFWNRSSVSIPDTILQNQWYMEMYKLGSAARQGAAPISLQSIWTADNGKLPPWKGDFHHDLNTQLSYWPTYSGNHLDLEQGFIDWLIKYKPKFKKYTKQFYGTNGLNVPGVTTLTGEPMGGWIQYSFGPTVGAWLGQHFYWHWRYSMDRDFLKEQAYPWIKDVAIHLNELSVVDDDGKRKLPLSSSPEIHNNSREAWFGEMTNFDLSLVRWTYLQASELAMELGLKEEASKWENDLNAWPEYAVNESGLMFSPNLPYQESHRHFSHLMAIHPLGLIDPSKGEGDLEIIRNTIENLDAIGSSQWTGYSFSWLGNIKARALDGEGAAKALKDFATSFVLPNSFHANGDQSGTGKSNFTYRPFTLEGNFAFAAGIHEMLIQSHAGVVNIFPAIPSSWKNVAFDKLRTEGAFLVSAEMKSGEVYKVEIKSLKGGTLRVQNPFTDSFECSVKYQNEENILIFETEIDAVITFIKK